MDVTIDPPFAHSVLPLVERVCVAANVPRDADGRLPQELTFRLQGGLGVVAQPHSIMARLQGTGVEPMEPNPVHSLESFRLGELEFTISPTRGTDALGRHLYSISAQTWGAGLADVDWAEFWNLLFRAGVLRYESREL